MAELTDEKLKKQEPGDLPADDEISSDEKERLNIDIRVDTPSACERHVTVTIPREDIKRRESSSSTAFVRRSPIKSRVRC